MGFRPEDLRKEADLFFLCNPQNPGGTVFRRDELERIAAATGEAVIVSDEIHCDLVLDPGLRHVPIASLSREVSRRTVTLMSASKTFNFPAAGCAWAIIEDERLRRAFSADLTAHVLHSPSVFGYEATLAAFRGGDAWLAAQLEYLRGNRDLVERTLGSTAGLPMAHVEATYLAWIDATSLKARDAQQLFLDAGVALSPGTQFGAPGGFVRLNFATQRARLAEALGRMRAGRTSRAAVASGWRRGAGTSARAASLDPAVRNPALPDPFSRSASAACRMRSRCGSLTPSARMCSSVLRI